MQTLACPECGLGIQGTITGKTRKHNASSRKFDLCPASGLTADEYNAQHQAERTYRVTLVQRIYYTADVTAKNETEAKALAAAEGWEDSEGYWNEIHTTEQDSGPMEALYAEVLS